MINTKEKESIWDGMKSVNFSAVLLCVLSFFVSRICLFNSYYCVGIAYVGCMYFNKEMRRWSELFALLGLISLGTLDFNVARYGLMLILIAASRKVLDSLKVECDFKNQLYIVGIGFLVINCLSYLTQSVSLYKLIVSLLEGAVVVGLMSILQLSVKIIYKKKEGALSEYELASIALLLALFICGCIDFYVTVPLAGKIYFRDVLIFIILIGSLYLGGMGSGTIISIIVSSVLVIIGYIPSSFVTIYVFATLVGGLFNHLERIGIIFAMTLGLLLSFALFNNKIVDPTIMGAFCVASVISLILPRSYFGIASWYEGEKAAQMDYHLHDLQGMVSERLKKFSAAFSSLARQFENISRKNFALEISDMNEMIEATGESMCKDCAMRHFCWEEYLQDTYRSCYQMLRVLDKQGSIKEGDIPEQFKKACINAESFAFTMGMVLDVHKNDCKWHENFNEARRMIGQQFTGVAESIHDLSVRVDETLSFDEALESRVRRELLQLGVYTRDIMVLKVEDKNKEVYLYCNYKGEADYKERVQRGIEKALEMELEIKKYEYFLEEAYCYFEFSEKRRFRLASSVQFSAKEEVSGDVYSYLELDNGTYLMALADGMGSGKLAKRESEMTIELLEKFLEAGFGSEVVIRLINSALVLKSDVECSSTIDAILIDEYTGIATFYKAGASSSFILRDGEVITVKASSLPIGILSEVDLICFKKQLRDGDILIMVTDGMLEDRDIASDRETTFKHFILESHSNSPEYLARFLMDKTKTLLASEQNDDMTILVTRIWEAD